MIVSHEHRFIWIKNRKVAGSSIEACLAPHCGPDDIISRDPCEPPIARNFDPGHSLIRELSGTFNPVQHARSIRDWRHRPTFYTHLDAFSIRSRVGRKVWSSYFKFCFERNPWDKCLSFYYWYYRRHDTPPLDFKAHMLKRHFLNDRFVPTDWRRYSIGQTVAVDFIGRYERLHEDISRIGSELGLPLQLNEQEKTVTRPDSTRSLAAQYDDETRERVARLFRREIAHLGYEFPAISAAGTKGDGQQV
ncbi:MAG: sulfotransferase family 2 domain-containing protein [Planctomycetota bacterium]|jgi:hypothetical protein